MYFSNLDIKLRWNDNIPAYHLIEKWVWLSGPQMKGFPKSVKVSSKTDMEFSSYPLRINRHFFQFKIWLLKHNNLYNKINPYEDLTLLLKWWVRQTDWRKGRCCYIFRSPENSITMGLPWGNYQVYKEMCVYVCIYRNGLWNII